MPYGYIIAQVDVKNETEYAAYRAQVPATVAQYGGEFIARGGKSQGLEGTPPAGRTVIIRFPSYERALEWYNSPEYAGPLALRKANSEGRVLIVEGV